MKIASIPIFNANKTISINQNVASQPQPYLNYLKNLSYDRVSFGAEQKDTQKVFDNYNPKFVTFENYSLPVHNNKIAQRLKPDYTVDEFESLLNFADEKGVFDLNYNEKTGFFKTSVIDSKENSLMSDLIWVTDTSRYMPIVKEKYPDKCIPLMENISKYYKKQERTMEKVINNPLLFELNHGYPHTSKYGSGQVFNPENMKSHKWFTRTRLESMGLYLQTMGDLIKDGFDGKPYGYKNSAQVSDEVVNSIATCAKYLKAINYPYAKSCNAWEEATFSNTTTSDVAIVNEGFRKIMDVIYSPEPNKETQLLKERLLASKHGDVFKDEKTLKDLLKIGEYRIKNDDMSEAYGERKYDAAMSFVSHSESYDKNDVINDIQENVKRLMMLEEGDSDTKPLVRRNGIIRYNTDRYLRLDADIVKPEKGKKRVFLPNSEAQWFMVTDISKGYGIQLKKLLNHIEAKDTSPNKKEKELIDMLLAKETEYINRGYARITGPDSHKANGKKCQEYLVPEAYQAVTSSRGIKYVPGTHSPLAWAQASLYDASKVYLDNLKTLENIN